MVLLFYNLEKEGRNVKKSLGIFGLMLMLFVSGCSSDDETAELKKGGNDESSSAQGAATAIEEDLAGIWQYSQYAVFYEFGEDGTFYLHAANLNHYNTYKGTYKIDGNKIITALYNGDKSEIPFSVEGETLTFHLGKNEEEHKRTTKEAMKDYFAKEGLTPSPLLASIKDKKVSLKTIAENKIVTGVWEDVDFNHYYEFKQDGTYFSNTAFVGLYKVDRDKLILKYEDGQEEEIPFSVEGDVLTYGVGAEYEEKLIRSTKEAMYEYLGLRTLEVRGFKVNDEDGTSATSTVLKETEVFDKEPSDNRNSPILSFENNKPLKNTKSFKNGEEDKELPIKLQDGKATIYIGQDHPNGMKIRLVKGDIGIPIYLEQVNDEILDEFGEFVDYEGFSLTVGTYDFNNDKNEEIIITIGDNLVTGQVWVYSYHEVDDISKINPFYMEMTASYQSKIWIEKNKILIPYGSQGLFDEYVWYEDGFLTK